MTTIIGLAEQQQACSGLVGRLPAASRCAGRRMVVVPAESACWLLADIPAASHAAGGLDRAKVPY